MLPEFRYFSKNFRGKICLIAKHLFIFLKIRTYFVFNFFNNFLLFTIYFDVNLNQENLEFLAFLERNLPTWTCFEIRLVNTSFLP